MERFLGQEGWLFRFLDRLWDLIVLNVLFIITCIPLFTVGAAISALYTVTMKGPGRGSFQEKGYEIYASAYCRECN